MFVDKVNLSIKAGDGGDGLISFRRERYIAKGGPNGGDGGNGGDVIFKASNNQNTLANFRYNKQLKAQNGAKGGQSNKHGRSGEDLVIEVPVGTVIFDKDNETLADLFKPDQEEIVAKGGKGGFGNAHFTSSIRQAPRVAEKGEKGQVLDLILELKMIADVGLVGLPNAGKSSFLTAVSNARPEIADYPFTTLIPHLGVADVNKRSLLIADIPGLIKGASEGKGLGDAFLKHVSRNNVLLHLIDVNSVDIANDYQTIRSELAAYSKELAKKPEVVAITKCETVTAEDLENKQKLLQTVLPKNAKLFVISSYAQKGLKELLFTLQAVVDLQVKKQQDKKAKKDELPVIKLAVSQDDWKVKKTKNGFLVTGQKIGRFAAKTDFNNPAGVSRLKDIMYKMGITKELENKKIKPGDKIILGDREGNAITY